MLTREVYLNLTKAHRKNTVSISFSIKWEGKELLTYKQQPCYNPLAYALSVNLNKNVEYVVVAVGRTIPTDPITLTENIIFFQEDSPLYPIVLELYNSSYKDWCDFEEFKELFIKNGIVLEWSVISKWCAATLYALLIMSRDVYKETARPDTKSYLGFYTQAIGTAQYGCYWLPGVASYVKTKYLEVLPFTIRPMKTIYSDKEIVDAGANCNRKIFTQPFGKECYWNNGGDYIQFLFSGVFTKTGTIDLLSVQGRMRNLVDVEIYRVRIDKDNKRLPQFTIKQAEEVYFKTTEGLKNMKIVDDYFRKYLPVQKEKVA